MNRRICSVSRGTNGVVNDPFITSRVNEITKCLLVGKAEGKELLVRPRLVDNIKLGLVQLGWDCVHWIGLA